MATRTLRPDEQTTAQQIFVNSLDFSRVRISEGSQIPNRVGQIGALLRGKPAPEANAITVGNTSYFPRELTLSDVDLAWLMHELTHQWQYQHFGIRYLAEAIVASTYVYTNPGEDSATALVRCHDEGKKFSDFNREQQGDIIRDYFFALRQSQNVVGTPPNLAAWDPYLDEIRSV